jgi:hypothetical protein
MICKCSKEWMIKTELFMLSFLPYASKQEYRIYTCNKCNRHYINHMTTFIEVKYNDKKKKWKEHV